MHPQTRAIAEFETEADAKAAGYTIPLSPLEAADLRDIHREDRMRAIKTWRRRSKKRKR